MPDPTKKSISICLAPILSVIIPQGSAVIPKRRYIQKESPKTSAMSKERVFIRGITNAGNTSILKWHMKWPKQVIARIFFSLKFIKRNFLFSVFKCPLSGKYHTHICLITGLNDLPVSKRPTRLNHPSYPFSYCHIHPISKGEKSI